MTLNVTLVGPKAVLQVSDRRFSRIGSREVADDNGNKAVVVGFSNALVSITFTGVATFGANMRLDEWLAEQMQDAGVAELDPVAAAEFIRDKTSELFEGICQSIPTKDVPSHAFVIAGWELAARGRAFAYVVSNTAEDPTKFTISQEFVVKGKSTGMLITGLRRAVSRPMRRRLLARLKDGCDLYAAEEAAVGLIREAAQNSEWAWAINEDCMAVAVSKDGLARATFHAKERRFETRAPIVLWKSEIGSVLVKNAALLVGPGYGVAFGTPQTRFQLLVGGSGVGRADNKTEFHGQVRISQPKFGPVGKEGDSGTIFTFLDKPVPLGRWS